MVKQYQSIKSMNFYDENRIYSSRQRYPKSPLRKPINKKLHYSFTTPLSNVGTSQVAVIPDSIYPEIQIQTTLITQQNNNSKTSLIRIEGHRGAGALVHENTLQAFQKAIDLNLDGVEFDLWLTKDNIVVVFHGGPNGELLHLKNENYNNTKLIKDCTYAELQQLSLENGEKIPSLEQVIEICKDKIKMNIEFKGKEYELAYETLKQIQYHGLTEKQVSFSSFNHQMKKFLEQASQELQFSGQFKFGYLAHEHEELPDFQLLCDVKDEGNSLNLPIKLCIPEIINQAKNRKLLVSVYIGFDEIEDFQLYQKLQTLGIHTIITNQPILLKQFLLEQQKTA